MALHETFWGLVITQLVTFLESLDVHDGGNLASPFDLAFLLVVGLGVDFYKLADDIRLVLEWRGADMPKFGDKWIR